MDQHPTTSDRITQFLSSLGYTAIPFRQNASGHLLINAKINGVEGVYMLDTGAGTTVIDAKQADRLHLNLHQDEMELTGGGVGGHGMENVPSYNNTIEINDFKIDTLVVAVMSLESAWASLASVGAHDELFGILGVDILKPGNAIIEFNSMTIYLMQP